MPNFVERDFKSFNQLRFLESYMAGHNGFIAGGCFKNIIQKKKVKDIDIFFESISDFEEADCYYKNESDFVFVYENNKVISYYNTQTKIRIELIKSVFGKPQQVLDQFDFTITKFALKRESGEEGDVYSCLFVNTFFEHLSTGKLVIDNQLLFPVSSFERSYRYRDYGFGLCRESKQILLESLKLASLDDLSNDLYFGLD